LRGLHLFRIDDGVFQIGALRTPARRVCTHGNSGYC
jgi:hypothetical protein